MCFKMPLDKIYHFAIIFISEVSLEFSKEGFSVNYLILAGGDEAGLPLWAWIVIAVVAVAAIVAVVVLIKAHRTQRMDEEPAATESGQSADVDAPAETVAAPSQEKTQPVKDSVVPLESSAQNVGTEKAVKADDERTEDTQLKSDKSRTAQKSGAKTNVAAKSEKADAPKSDKSGAVQPKSQPAPAKEEPKAADSAPAEAAKPAGPKVYHITKRVSDGKWQIKFNKGKKAIKLFDTQAQAIDYAKALAQNQEASIMIHKEDGSFRKLRYDK